MHAAAVGPVLFARIFIVRAAAAAAASRGCCGCYRLFAHPGGFCGRADRQTGRQDGWSTPTDRRTDGWTRDREIETDG